MPLDPYLRPDSGTYWARGRIVFNGEVVTPYFRTTTNCNDLAAARAWCVAEEGRRIREHLVGPKAGLTFAEAVVLYRAKPAEAKFLKPILARLGSLQVAKISPDLVRSLAPQIYPRASTDTWRRQVLAPVSAVINNAHQQGRCGPIRIRGWSTAERVAQDRIRGKTSRAPKTPGDRAWLAAFVRQSEAEGDLHLAGLALLMWETAARIGQAIALRQEDLDEPGSRIWISASKGHAPQWVSLSSALTKRLADLAPRTPVDRKTHTRLAPRLFGYATRGGPLKRWRALCKAAGIDYRPPHSAGRHGYYTELRVRQGLDPITVARAGRWSSSALPDRVYAHPEADERALRDLMGVSTLVSEKRSAR